MIKVRNTLCAAALVCSVAGVFSTAALAGFNPTPAEKSDCMSDVMSLCSYAGHSTSVAHYRTLPTPARCRQCRFASLYARERVPRRLARLRLPLPIHKPETSAL